jgi:hypothetical protein
MTTAPHITCPCCGQPMNAGKAPIDALEAAPLSAVKRTIVRRLAKAYPRSVSADALIDEIYRGSREPENARTALNVQISRLRDKLPLYGWTIPRAPDGKGNLAVYKLEPLP